MSYLRISELNAFNPKETVFKEMAVTVPISDTHEETRKVNVDDYIYPNEEAAINAIKDIFKQGKVPFILPRQISSNSAL